MRRALVIAVSLLIAAAVPMAAAAKTGDPTPADYRRIEGLSQPDFPRTGREAVEVAMADGVTLHVEVVRPDPAVYGAGRRWPVILEASPYHGTLADRDGTRILPDPKDAAGHPLGLTGYFAPRGYAVVMVDLRGTGLSSGCLDHLGPKDAADLKRVVEWAADQPWSTGRVAMLGHSYVGSTPIVAAAQHPRGLVTIVPSAGLASMYDHQFQRGVPYRLQWAGPIEAYEELALKRDLPGGEHFGKNAAGTGCGIPASSATAGTGQLTGQYQAWHSARDYRTEATALDIPVFIVHGVNDNAARIPAAEWFFGYRFDRPGDKVWLGQWDHGAAGATVCRIAHPNCRIGQWTGALHAWLDRQLQQRPVSTGPAVEVFLNDGTALARDRWSAPTSAVTVRPDASASTVLVDAAPSADSAVSFAVTPDGRAAAVLRSNPLDRDLVVLGVPRMDLDLAVTAPALDVIVRLDSEHRGVATPITYCATQPQLREGVDRVAPIVPGQRMRLHPQCFTAAHHVAKGDRLVMTVSTTSPHHVPMLAADPRVTLFSGPDATGVFLPTTSGRLQPDPK